MAALVGPKLASRAVIPCVDISCGAILIAAKKVAIARAEKQRLLLRELQTGDCAGNYVFLNLHQVRVRKCHPENRVHARAVRNANHNS